MKSFRDRVRVKRSSAGLGLFAIDTIKKGEVIEYIGPIISAKEADEVAGKYLFEINSKWTINGTTRKNLARYINHSCKPNCIAYTKGLKVFIEAKRTINPGEELHYNYGKEYFDEHIKPYGCRCGAH